MLEEGLIDLEGKVFPKVLKIYLIFLKFRVKMRLKIALSHLKA